MNATWRTLIVLGIVLGTGACALLPRQENGPAGGSFPEARVQVANHNWADAVIYASHGGGQMRLGLVNSMATVLFRLPPAIIRGGAPISFVVSPIGSRDSFRTEPVYVAPGQTVEFQVQNHLAISSVTVWTEQ